MYAGAPTVVTQDLLKSFNIALVVRGTVSETAGFEEQDAARYAYPKQLDIFRCDPVPVNMCLTSVRLLACCIAACQHVPDQRAACSETVCGPAASPAPFPF